MSNIETKKINRFKFLNKLYEISNGDERIITQDYFRLGDELGFSRQETSAIVQYLRGEDLIQHKAQRAISISHQGILEIESALLEPEKSTSYFPPIINYINVQQMTNSQIQQGSVQSTQTIVTNKNELKELKNAIKQVKNNLTELNISDDDLKEATAEISTLEAQVNSSRPKRTIISESLYSLHKIIEGATGGIIASKLLSLLSNLLL